MHRHFIVSISHLLHDTGRLKRNDGDFTTSGKFDMRHLSMCLLFACAGAAIAQTDMAPPESDQDLMQAWPAWLVGDHEKARRHFRAAAQRGNPLAQHNLALMLLHGEGGPCGVAEARVLLRKAAGGGVKLSREALQQMRWRATAPVGVQQPFACWPARRAAPATRPLQATTPTAGR